MSVGVGKKVLSTCTRERFIPIFPGTPGSWGLVVGNSRHPQFLDRAWEKKIGILKTEIIEHRLPATRILRLQLLSQEEL